LICGVLASIDFAGWGEGLVRAGKMRGFFPFGDLSVRMTTKNEHSNSKTTAEA
jgi:hypothetical protein